MGLTEGFKNAIRDARRSVVEHAMYQRVNTRKALAHFMRHHVYAGAPRAALISETMARRFFPDENPIGKRFKYGDANSASAPLTIVGVVADVHRQGMEKQVIPQIFTALSQNPNRGMTCVARTSSDPLKLAPAVRHELRSIDKAATVYGVTTVQDQLAEFNAQRRFQTSLLGSFSAIAILLAGALGWK